MMTLKQFQHEMWLQNCDERDNWGMAVLVEEVYIAENEKFLMREWLEDDNS
jgi:hypothetical protein